MNRLILDTNIVSAYLKRHPLVTPRLTAYYSYFGKLDITIITYYEILKGLYYKDAHGPLRVFWQFIAHTEIHSLNDVAADESAKIAGYLMRIGRENQYDTDVLIAGICILLGYGICTNNEKDFQNIPGLQLENWTK